ncbi:MAG TPA: MlaD family protein [Pirellulaceae bacterium]|nr:MlaD family protein [Pirellulaceae bacterium]
MDERLLRLRVGIVVVVAVIMTVLLVMLFGDLQLPGTRKYTLYIRFPRAPGVAVGTPVRKSGISIGRVSEIDILDDATVRITADIDASEKVLTSEICKIASSSVLGDPVLEFVLADTNIPGEPLPDGAEIDGIVAGNPLEVIGNLEQDIKAALISIRGAGDEVRQTAQGLRGALAGEDDQLPRILQKTERALDQLNKSLLTVDNVFGDPQMQENLKRSLQDLPRFFDDARGTLSKANDTFDGFQRMSQRAEMNLENLERFTKPLSERGPVLVDNIDGILGNVNSLTEQLDDLARGFSEQNGTIGRLLRDQTIYDRLDRSLANVEEITFRLRPIMEDVRIFTDKIARDPRQLGVKGALDRRPLGTGVKQSTFMEPLPGEHEVFEVEEEPPLGAIPARRPWLGRP